MTPRLMTVSWSHFCEKARWALQRGGEPFEERAHLAIFHYLPNILARGGIQVPTLVTEQGVIGDSTEILQWISHHPGGAWLYPPGIAEEVLALEERCDEIIGPAARRIAYFYVNQDPSLPAAMDLSSVPRWERAILSTVLPAAAIYLRWRLAITEEAVQDDRLRIFALLDELAVQLADGRPYLCGQTFTAADLTLAALLSPVILPPQLPELPRIAALGAEYRGLVDAVRAHPVGSFALRLYREERGR